MLRHGMLWLRTILGLEDQNANCQTPIGPAWRAERIVTKDSDIKMIGKQIETINFGEMIYNEEIQWTDDS